MYISRHKNYYNFETKQTSQRSLASFSIGSYSNLTRSFFSYIMLVMFLRFNPFILSSKDINDGFAILLTLSCPLLYQKENNSAFLLYLISCYALSIVPTALLL